MTREEAIYRLKNTAWLGTDKDREETEQAVDLAIEALSADAILTKIQIDDIDKAKTSSQLLDDLAVDMVKAMGRRIVEVVRCKDCRYRNGKVNRKGFEVCDATGMDITDDDYCSFGERRDE